MAAASSSSTEPPAEELSPVVRMGRQLVLAGGLIAVLVLPAVFYPDAIKPHFAPKLLALYVAAALAAAGLLLSQSGSSRQSPGLGPAEFLGASFLTWGLLSVVAASSVSFALLGAYPQATGWLFWAALFTLWLALRLTRPAPEEVSLLFWAALAAGAAVASVALLQLIQWEPAALGLPLPGEGRAAGSLGNPVFLGAYLAVLAPLGIHLLAEARSLSLRMLAGGLTVLVVAGLLGSLTRGAWLAVAFGLGVLFLSRPDLRPWPLPPARYGNGRVGAAALLVLLLGLALGLIALSGRPEAEAAGTPGGDAGIQAGAGRGVDELTGAETLETRLGIWETAVTAIGERPIFGWGPNNFFFAANRHTSIERLNLEAGGRDFDAHNGFLELAATWGLPGFILFLGWLAFFVREAWRSLDSGDGRPRSTGIIGGVLVLTWLATALTRPFNLGVAPVAFVLAAAALPQAAAVAPGPQRRTAGRGGRFRTQPGPAPAGFVRLMPPALAAVLLLMSIGGVAAAVQYYRAEVVRADNRVAEGVWAESPEGLRFAVQLMPHEEFYWLNLAQAERLADHPDAALAAATEAVRLAPEDPRAHALQAAVFLAQGDLRRAAEEGALAIEYGPLEAEGYVYAGLARQALGEEAAAVHLLETATTLPSLDGVMRYKTARALAELGRPEAARRQYELVLEMMPGFTPAREALRSLQP